MKTLKFGRSTARSVIAVAVLTLVAGPVTAAIWRVADAQETVSSPESVAALAVQLKASITQTTGGLAGRIVADADAQSAYVAGLEGAIVASGAAPQTAIDALEATQAEMKAAGTLPPPAEAAIIQLLARIREAMQQEAPAATGAENGLPAFGAPPTSGSGGGGPDYAPPV
ncbi:hypothetical protein [Brevundimonas sp.]|jgi:hypothetical protein|uniref:hypothetical protein n=1 Tax=Brevundimonas sp. TaxID=1871086 RepID=UPI0037BEB4B1